MTGMGPSTILYCGDPHGRFDHILAAARAADYDAIVVVGDLDLTRPLHDELGEVADRLWYIPGNHDSDSDTAWANLCDGPLADRNLHGRVVILPSGMRLAGLGGVFRGSVWNPATDTPPTYKNRAEHARAADAMSTRALSSRVIGSVRYRAAGISHSGTLELFDRESSTLRGCGEANGGTD